jgi:hypothetical protein
MFHSGKEFPKYLECTFKQLRVFNSDIVVYFLTDAKYLNLPLFKKYQIISINKDEHHSTEVEILNTLYKRDSSSFWMITTTRFIYIQNFLLSKGLEEVYLFENDILLYFTIADYKKIFSCLYSNLAVTVAGPDKCTTGFMYIKNGRALKDMTDGFIRLLVRFGKKGICHKFKLDMVNEMTLMRAFNINTQGKGLATLPILPFGDWSEGYNEFNSIFDPASWGQFVGGTTDGIPGAKPEDHYIGQILRQHNDYTVLWKETDKGRVPYFRYDTQEVKINNLHIHSKQLHKYMS